MYNDVFVAVCPLLRSEVEETRMVRKEECAPEFKASPHRYRHWPAQSEPCVKDRSLKAVELNRKKRQ